MMALVQGVRALEDLLQLGRRYVSVEEADSAAEVIKRHDGELLVSHWVHVDTRSDHGTHVFEMVP